MRHEFHGKLVTISYDDEVCQHAARCVRDLPGVFDAARTPWIDPDGGSIEAITQTVASCPSGALQVQLTR